MKALNKKQKKQKQKLYQFFEQGRIAACLYFFVWGAMRKLMWVRNWMWPGSISTDKILLRNVFSMSYCRMNWSKQGFFCKKHRKCEKRNVQRFGKHSNPPTMQLPLTVTATHSCTPTPQLPHSTAFLHGKSAISKHRNCHTPPYSAIHNPQLHHTVTPSHRKSPTLRLPHTAILPHSNISLFLSALYSTPNFVVS